MIAHASLYRIPLPRTTYCIYWSLIVIGDPLAMYRLVQLDEPTFPISLKLLDTGSAG